MAQGWLWRTCIAAASSWCLCTGTLRAQDAGSGQSLTVWIVRPATAADRTALRAQQDIESIKQYRETTAGSFGKPASEAGQTAGSYGKPASEEGRPASEVGQTAGSYGQTASSLPGNVKSQTAGSYGQTAGSFGTSASDYTGAPKPVSVTESTVSRDAKGPRWTEFLNGFREGNSVGVRVVEVGELELKDRLAAAEGKATFPDVLLADRMPEWWPPVMSGMSVKRLADMPNIKAFPEESPARQTRANTPYLQAYGMVQAPHPEATREFLEWWFARRRFSPSAGKQPEMPSPVEALAREAALTVLNGGSVEAMADPAMARFNAPLTRAFIFGGLESQGAADLQVDAVAESARANSRLAVVRLHAVCLSRTIYGDLYPLVLLRANSRGQWRVLQITLGMSAADARAAQRLLEPYAAGGKEVDVSMPIPASPPDGDRRIPGAGLRLAWDASSEDGLLLVEWQLGHGERSVASSVMLVSNTEGRAHTEAAAPFASIGGAVRWRVWALGHGGTVQLSEWRAVEMR